MVFYREVTVETNKRITRGRSCGISSFSQVMSHPSGRVDRWSWYRSLKTAQLCMHEAWVQCYVTMPLFSSSVLLQHTVYSCGLRSTALPHPTSHGQTFMSFIIRFMSFVPSHFPHFILNWYWKEQWWRQLLHLRTRSKSDLNFGLSCVIHFAL